MNLRVIEPCAATDAIQLDLKPDLSPAERRWRGSRHGYWGTGLDPGGRSAKIPPSERPHLSGLRSEYV
jgi:hypothetical protein